MVSPEEISRPHSVSKARTPQTPCKGPDSKYEALQAVWSLSQLLNSA